MALSSSEQPAEADTASVTSGQRWTCLRPTQQDFEADLGVGFFVFRNRLPPPANTKANYCI
jgi:hypothetical protein